MVSQMVSEQQTCAACNYRTTLFGDDPQTPEQESPKRSHHQFTVKSCMMYLRRLSSASRCESVQRCYWTRQHGWSQEVPGRGGETCVSYRKTLEAY